MCSRRGFRRNIESQNKILNHFIKGRHCNVCLVDRHRMFDSKWGGTLGTGDKAGNKSCCRLLGSRLSEIKDDSSTTYISTTMGKDPAQELEAVRNRWPIPELCITRRGWMDGRRGGPCVRGAQVAAPSVTPLWPAIKILHACSGQWESTGLVATRGGGTQRRVGWAERDRPRSVKHEPLS
jgi:hypothetical protein